MTRALDAVVAKLATLPAEEQVRIASGCSMSFGTTSTGPAGSRTQDALSKLASEARADLAAGSATELDPDKL